ncbi:MAG: nucleoside transporter C-terminal domain-containing protein [Eubacteriales bacterium]
MNVVLNILGIFVVLGLMVLLSYKRKAIPYKLIVKAIIAQFVIAIILVKIPLGRLVIEKVSDAVTSVISSGYDGLAFVFGSLASAGAPAGFIMGIQVLGNIVFLSALVSLLYYLGVLGFVVKKLGKLVGKIMGTSDVESFVSVANMFLGQTESPILVGKYIGKMTDSEVMVVLVSGMGSMSVSILGGYTALGIPMEYLLIASALVPIGGILVAKIILPQTEEVVKIEDLKMDNKGNNTNVIEAVAEGAITGMHIAMSIGATLIAIVSIVALINKGFAFVGLELQQIFGYIFAPFGFLMGLDVTEVMTAGSLLGSKVIMNEFIAFEQLGQIISGMSERTAMIVTISLCGFANISSLGICVSGIAVICPEKRSTLARLVFRAMLGGVAVSILSAMIVGLVMWI